MRLIGYIALILAFATTGFVGCKKSDNQPAKMYYNYFPTEIGVWTEYEVREIIHNANVGSDTSYYFLKEVVAEEFIDNQGRVTFRIERFKKDSLNEEYTISDVWYSNLTNTTAEKVEENIRFVKLVFPVNENKSWDGNAYNTDIEWDYEYDSLHVERSYNNLIFDSTIKVQQVDNVNPIQKQLAYEVYANYIGLIRKSYVNIENGDGREIEMTIIDYGR
ncbi:hypothetical protein [Parvicella tangerina]|uniref:Uncharacterized protein n=1 Tax=Parvicella tangerina TaxID=2829795 RepID=A0A916N9T5_9FLAO|nr:hypothetical protein [Parvicella tangerina]CAG5077881.1 hypothetical protein CRYO30217_00506 [Parvicella tangerina]